ncbi:MAG: hypothetical protein IPF51_12160 [Dehalococcoidia bacterium]|uniref:hypothetical protein n=1 Tax=Candidatus Amarobacter glycogenicus TaxID=3140699 RepID=UPI003137422E|nr:hypothetical protein [Dehalococcoidia bacterium]
MKTDALTRSSICAWVNGSMRSRLITWVSPFQALRLVEREHSDAGLVDGGLEAAELAGHRNARKSLQG